jgi:hypothetical protein
LPLRSAPADHRSRMDKQWLISTAAFCRLSRMRNGSSRFVPA